MIRLSQIAIIFLPIVGSHYKSKLYTFRSPSFLLACGNPALEVFGWKANLSCGVSAEVGVERGGDAAQQTKAHSLFKRQVPPIPFFKIFGSDSRDKFMRGRVGIGDIVNWFSKLIFLSIAVVDHFSLLLLAFRSPSFLLACGNPFTGSFWVEAGT
jgi:hypothetical protein